MYDREPQLKLMKVEHTNLNIFYILLMNKLNRQQFKQNMLLSCVKPDDLRK